MFQKNEFENLKKLESILIFYIFYPPISKQSASFSPIPPFLEKTFHPHPYCQISGTQSPAL